MTAAVASLGVCFVAAVCTIVCLINMVSDGTANCAELLVENNRLRAENDRLRERLAESMGMFRREEDKG